MVKPCSAISDQLCGFVAPCTVAFILTICMSFHHGGIINKRSLPLFLFFPIEITFIIVPVVAPIFTHMGIDLLWVGILIAINLQTSFLTPPFGFSLFYLKGVTTGDIYRGISPFVVIQLIVLIIVILMPETVTWLPEALGR